MPSEVTEIVFAVIAEPSMETVSELPIIEVVHVGDIPGDDHSRPWRRR